MHFELLALSLLLSQAPAVPLCSASESTLACKCKQGGSADICALWVGREVETVKGALDVVETVEEKAKERSSDVVDTGCGAGQDPNNDDQTQCTGQDHHIISKTVWRALDRHSVLQGLYKYRDPRFVAQAKHLKAHCGYQDWHRKLDEKIAAWLKEHDDATAEEFQAYLREVYARPEIRARFPNGF